MDRPENSDEHRCLPRHAAWELTLQCDLPCRHCGSAGSAVRPNELSTSEGLDLIEQLAELGVHQVALIGGEAYLRRDWLELVRAIRMAGMECGMSSGGRGFHLERAHAAAEAGLQTVSIALDGLERTHDGLRGARGSYRSALAALTNLRAAGVPVSVSTQLDRLQRHELSPLLEVIIAHGVHSWHVQRAVARGRCENEADALREPSAQRSASARQQDLPSSFPELVELAHRCEEAGVRLWPREGVAAAGPYDAGLHGALKRGQCAACGAGRGSVGIEADGAIKSFPSLPGEGRIVGNVRDTRLRELWELRPSASSLRD